MKQPATRSGDLIRPCNDRGLNFARAAGRYYFRYHLDTSRVAYVAPQIFTVRCVHRNHVYTRCGKCFRSWIQMRL